MHTLTASTQGATARVTSAPFKPITLVNNIVATAVWCCSWAFEGRYAYRIWQQENERLVAYQRHVWRLQVRFDPKACTPTSLCTSSCTADIYRDSCARQWSFLFSKLDLDLPSVKLQTSSAKLCHATWQTVQDWPKHVLSSIRLHLTCSFAWAHQSFGFQQDGICTHATQLTAPMSLLHFDTGYLQGEPPGICAHSWESNTCNCFH